MFLGDRKEIYPTRAELVAFPMKMDKWKGHRSKIKDLDLEVLKIGKTLLEANRLVIQLGDTKQLVYCWFQQRGRVITNEYLAKWYLFWDALTRNRTDGALVRLTTVVKPRMDINDADRELSEFAKAISPELIKYIPD